MPMRKIHVQIKPLSVNEAWKGKRFRSAKYGAYRRDLGLLLPGGSIWPGKLRIEYEFGFSNPQSDIDNPVKPVQDILQEKYGFNDANVYEVSIKKTIVPAGQEFIEITIISLEDK